MKVGDRYFRSIWQDKGDPGVVRVIDQRRLPFSFDVMALRNVEDVYDAIRDMAVRGAPLIGAVQHGVSGSLSSGTAAARRGMVAAEATETQSGLVTAPE
jgi:methylthioribose-1-phosphate isomerase